MRASSPLLLCVALAGVGCGDGATPPAGAVTWYRDVAPVAYAVCGECHRPGGIGGFSIFDPAAVHDLRDAIAASVASGRMPPVAVDNSGACHTFRNARTLTPDEVARFRRWVDAGAPMGATADAPAAPPAPTPIRPDIVFDTRVDYTPQPKAGVMDETRCFIVPALTDRRRYVTAYQVTPGDARVVHHLVVHTAPSNAALREALHFEGADGRPGIDCLAPDHPLIQDWPRIVTWAPSIRPARLPPGLGFTLEPNAAVAFEIHYSTRNGAFPDRTRITLQVEDAVEHPLRLLSVWGDMEHFALPPRRTAATADGETTWPLERPVRVWAGTPHMHELGRDLRVDLEHDDERSCLIHAPAFHFTEHAFWFFDEPVTVSPGDELRIRCTYDTTSRSTVTRWDQSTDGEMCVNDFYVSD